MSRRAPHGSAPAGATRRAPGEVRLIGGRWKRSKLVVPDLPGLRPTPDRVRETLFNWLGQDLSGWHCVDAFAGSGALGFEAASRGAASVLLVEREPGLLAQLQQAKVRLGAGTVQLQRADAMQLLRGLPPDSLDLVLLDPPFDATSHAELLLAAARLVRPGAWVYLEAPRAWNSADLLASGLELHRHLRAGAVHAHLLRRPPGV